MSDCAAVSHRTPSQSRVEMTQLVLPGDANTLGNAFGGKLMQWIDIAAGVAARRHCGGVAVTASIDGVQFMQPIRLGDVVVLQARVTRSWRSSMEIQVKVTCDASEPSQPRRESVNAFLTFVGIDAQGRPRPVPELRPETEQERRAHQEAEVRRLGRLEQRRG